MSKMFSIVSPPLYRTSSVSQPIYSKGYRCLLYTSTSDGTIAVEQLELLRADMQAEYEKGNWCIAGGDFNKDLLGQSEEIFGGSAEGYTWAQPLPEGIWDGTDLSLVAPLDRCV